MRRRRVLARDRGQVPAAGTSGLLRL